MPIVSARLSLNNIPQPHKYESAKGNICLAEIWSVTLYQQWKLHLYKEFHGLFRGEQKFFLQ